MFNYITVNFRDVANKPTYVYSATLYQDRYKHELVDLVFRDWDIDYDNVLPGSPVSILFKGVNSVKNFYGYVHHLEPKRTPGTNFTNVTLIGASYVFKSTNQDVYRNTTADQVIKKLATKHKFVCYAEPHNRVYPQISQSGQSDWELIIRLAKQCGYTVRTENTELYFQPMLKDFTDYRESAPVFTMRPAQSIYGSSLYSFTPLIGETIEYDDAHKAATAISGVDLTTASPIKHTQPILNKKTKTKSKQEFFDAFDSKVVANTIEVARYEAAAADARNSFPYRATAEVLGSMDLKPNYPVYLNGVGKTYSGFWTVLKATHKIVEEKRNVYKYTTVLEIGTDSLGSANQWTDGQTVQAPDALIKRVIIPNVSQTNTVPTSSLNVTSNINSPQLTAPFGSVTNRPITLASGQATEPNVWKSDLTSLNTATAQTTKSPAIIARITKNTGAIL